MAILYVAGCLFILAFNYEYILPAVKLICLSAFAPDAVGGGLAGGGIMIAAHYGIARGLFSNESGMGSAPLVAAAAKTRNPVRQALGTFWDTVVICAITGIVIVSSVLAYADVSELHTPTLGRLFARILHDATLNMDGGTLTKMAFSKIPVIGEPILMFGLFTFAFSTILGWSIYALRAVEYLFGNKGVRVYTWMFLVAVFCGAVINLNTVWTMADIFNALMAIPNLFALILLSNVIAKDTDKYLWAGRLDEE